MNGRPTLAMTVDLEEWNHGLGLPAGEVRLEEGTDWLLEQFSRVGLRATFFVLGEAAERHPALVRRIAELGHEVGFHGAHHRFLHQVGPRAFAHELAQGLPRLEDLSGSPVRGYRAPFFSITRRTAWALPLLREVGLAYDASIYPGPNDRYGWWGAPLEPARLPCGLMVFPVPILHAVFPLAFSGGTYLRMLPWQIIRMGLKQERAHGRAGMVYVHPWEVAHKLRWVPTASLRANVTRHWSRRRMRGRLQSLLAEERERIGAMEDVLASRPSLPIWDPSGPVVRRTTG